jgi:hypothetical protein
MMLSSIVTYMNGVEKLGVNFAKWKADIKMILAIMDQDHSLCEDKPIESLLSTRKLRPSGRGLTWWHS